MTGCDIRYSVVVDPRRHELAVTQTISAEAASRPLVLVSPCFVPGNYEFLPYGRDVFDLKATDGDGAELGVRRQGWQGYAISEGKGAVCLTYRAAAVSVDFSEGCGILDDRYGVILGTRYLMLTGHAGPVEVSYTVPSGWPILHPSGAEQTGPATWRYQDYQQLVDSPVCLGDVVVKRREIAGTPFDHVFLTQGIGFARGCDDFVDRVAQVSAACRDVFGSFPFSRYTYIFSLDPNDDWGLEHLTSTMIGLGPEVFTDLDAGATGVRTCAHELFHAWNVRRLRPAPLDDINFVNGDFTDGLWMAEGFTRYYEFLLCTRTGEYSPEQFFSSVVNYYTHLAALPAFGFTTPEGASHASYLNHGKFPGWANAAVDYYDQGMVIAFCADAALRCDGKTLDRVFCDFYDAFAGKNAGYTTRDIVGFFDDALPGLGQEIQRSVGRPAEIRLAHWLKQLGFEVTEAEVPTLGIVLEQNTGPGISDVLDGTPAGDSGLAAGDVITALNGYPFRKAQLCWLVANEGQVTLDIRRGDQSRRYEIPVGSRPAIAGLAWTGGPDQAALIAEWLGRPFEPEPRARISLGFYENFHGVMTVI